MRRLACILVLIILAIACPGKAAESLKPEDFAFGLPIETTGEGAIFQVVLPLEFYRGVVRNDLSDMCVFNRAKEVVPYAVKLPESETPAPPPEATLPIFPIPGEPGRELDGLSLRVQRDGTGTILHLDSSGQTVSAPSIVAYLVDASSLKKPAGALVFEWEPGAGGFTGRISVEGSDDLERWSRVVSGAVVASLHYGENSLIQNKVPLKSAAFKYLRIAWPSALRQVKLVKVTAELVEPAAEQPRSRVSALPGPKQEKPGEYAFVSPGPFPADRLKVILPQKNTLISVEILSREDEKAPWKWRVSGLAYDLRLEGTDVVSPDLAVPPVTDRFWLLRVRQGGGGPGQGAPGLELGWLPQHLLLVARGEGPFLLAYGNAGRRVVSNRSDELLAKFSESRGEKILFPQATVGAQIVLGGEAKRAVPVVDPRKAVLWGVLVLAVLVLGWMAVHLFRQMERRRGEGP